MKYEILNYRKYQQRIKDILENNPTNPNILKKESDLATTRFGFPVEHYTIGYGDNHLIFMGGTHGNEVIGVDFVTQMMAKIARGEGEFANFDPSTTCIHFVPLQNPEGFIISTSALDYGLDSPRGFMIDDSVNKKEELHFSNFQDQEALQALETHCKKYYAAYREDDIEARKKVNRYGRKHHHQVFQSPDFSCLKEYLPIQEQVMKIFKKTYYPQASFLDWRANASGIDLNANTPYHTHALEAQKNNEKVYGTFRYNTLRNYTAGPLGTATIDANQFGFEPENIGLFELIEDLYQSGKYCGMLTFHGTGGMIYHHPHDESLALSTKTSPNIPLEQIAIINQSLAEQYNKTTTYRILEAKDKTGVGDLIRANYPGELLIELSKMGGNPLGPYGDLNNYIPTIKTNMQAVSQYIDACIALKSKMYPEDLTIQKGL